jgi:hypothetical protein
MKRMLLYSSKIAFLPILFVTCVVSYAEPQVVCNKFNLLTKIKGATLDLSVDTDLPDNTVVMVTVSRSYLEKGNQNTYSVDYFSEKGTIEKWKSEQKISIDNGKWISLLKKKQEKMSRLGISFDVASISNKITVRMVVPINQPDPSFGKQNSNLTGKKVRTAGLRVVEEEIELDYPLDSPPVGKLSPSLDPRNLEVGKIYILSKETPLMPYHSPSNPLAALKQVKQIPKGGMVKIMETIQKNSTPWYKIIAFDQKNKRIGAGWINSTALLGQELQVHK